MIRIRTIPVPIDFSEPAAAAWQHARAFAEQFESHVHLLHIVAPPYLYDPWGTGTVSLRMVDLLAESEAVAKQHLAKLVPTAGKLAGRVVATTTTGIVVNQILEYISTKHVDLVIMGTHAAAWSDTSYWAASRSASCVSLRCPSSRFLASPTRKTTNHAHPISAGGCPSGRHARQF